MERKLIGSVSEQERDEIRTLFERKNGLNELFKVLDAENEALYNKLVADMSITATKFQSWWDEKAQKYQWDSLPDHRWRARTRTRCLRTHLGEFHGTS